MKTILAVFIACLMLSARATVFEYAVVCTGSKESPTNASPAVATGKVIYDDVARTLQMTAVFSNLIGTVSQTHIHAFTTAPFHQNSGIAVGNSTLPGFPLGVSSGVYSNTLYLTNTTLYNSGFLSANGGTAAGAEAALAASLAQNRAYWNIHTTGTGGFPGGEIRDFPTPVIRILNMQVGTNLTVTSSLATTNSRTVGVEYSTNLFAPVWTTLPVLTNSFANGTNEIICGKPPVNAAYLRVRALAN